MPQAYLHKIDPNCGPLIKKLKLANILEVYCSPGTTTEAYSHTQGISKAYRISPRFFEDGEVSRIMVALRATGVAHRTAPEPWNTQLLQDLSQLHFDTNGAKKYLQEYLTHLDLSKWCVDCTSTAYRTNGLLQGVRFDTDPPGKGRRTYRAQSLLEEVANIQSGKALFKLNDGYLVTAPETFRASKTAFLQFHYSKVIQKLDQRDFWTSQSATNQRLHHNLTELPKKLIDFVTLNGEPLTEVDIANSQVALLAHVMMHGDVLGLGVEFPDFPITPQTQSFIHDAQAGIIYDQVAKELLGADREVAKQEVIRWLFSGPGYVLGKATPIALLYGDANKWMKQVKKLLKAQAIERNDPKLGLAVYLQRLEAKIMVEQIYPKAKARGLTLYSKHDSFLVPVSQAQKMQELMQEVFSSYGIVMYARYKGPQIELSMAA
ncbi:hypothetical protein [Hymenobacter agri]